MNLLNKLEKIFNGSVWMLLFSFTALIMLWLGFVWQIDIPMALVQIYLGVLGAFAVNRTVKEYKNGQKD